MTAKPRPTILAALWAVSLLLSRGAEGIPLQTQVAVSPAGEYNQIKNPNTSRNIGVSPEGYIYVAYYGTNGIYVACSTNRGAAFCGRALVAPTNTECEIAVDEDGLVYVAWVSGADIMLSRSTDGGHTYSPPVVIGSPAASVHMAVSKPYVYILPRSGSPLYWNAVQGSGAFQTTPTDPGRVFADVSVDPVTKHVFVQTDDPDIRYLASTNRGLSFGSLQQPGGQSQFTTAMMAFGEWQRHLYIAGSGTMGYRIDLDTGIPAVLTLGEARNMGRTLTVDELGNLVDGFLMNDGTPKYAVSTNQGVTFDAAVRVAGSADSISYNINRIYGDIVAVYQTNGLIRCNVYENEIPRERQKADLGLQLLQSPTQAVAGADLVYQVTLSNFSHSAAVQIVVTNTLPGQVQYLGASAGCQHSGGRVTWSLGVLAGGDERTISITGRVLTTATEALTNLATLIAYTLDTNPANNEVSAETPLHRTLLVVADRGQALPAAGLHVFLHGAGITNGIQSPLASGRTQWVCQGWTLAQHSPATGAQTNVAVVLTNNTTLTWMWNRTNFWFTQDAAGRGSVLGATHGWYAFGGSLTLTAAPLAHAHFLQWTGDVPPGAETTTPLPLTMDQPRSVAALFWSDSYTHLVHSAHGTPFPTAGEHTNTYAMVITNHVTTPVAAGGATQYVCQGWTLAGYDPGSDTSTLFTLTVTNHSRLDWLWTTNVLFACASPGAGRVDGSTGGWKAWGSSVTVTATPNAYAVFKGWAGDLPDLLTNNPAITLAMDCARSVTARFHIDQYALTVDSAYGPATPAPGMYSYDDHCTLINQVVSPAAAGQGTQRVCSGWILAGHSPASGTTNIMAMTITNNATLTWLWEGGTLVRFDAAAQAGGLNHGHASGWYPLGGSVTVTAVPSAGAHFAGWAGDLPAVLTNNNPLTLTLDSRHCVTSRFWSETRQFTVLSEHGTACPPAGVHTVGHGALLTNWIWTPAVDAAGTQYVAAGWSLAGVDAISGTATNLRLALTNDATLTWLWGATNVLFQAQAVGTGQVTGAVTGWYAMGSSVTVTAEPAALVSFHGWRGDVPAANTNDLAITLVMNRARSIAAHFRRDHHTLWILSEHGGCSPEAGWWTNRYGTSITNRLTGAVLTGDGTQYVGHGWSLSDHAPASGTGSNCVMLVTNDAVLSWLWKTNVYFSRAAAGPGVVRGSNAGWYALGGSITITAAPSAGYMFGGWLGVPNAQTNQNPLTMALDQTRAVTGRFEVYRHVDVAILAMSIYYDDYDRTLDAHVLVQNKSTEPVNAGVLSVWVNKTTTAAAGELGDLSSVVGLLATNQTKIISFNRLETGSVNGQKTFRAFVDSQNTLAENNELNNQATSLYTITTGYPAFWFQAFAFESNVVLRWTNPLICGLSNQLVRVMYHPEHYPSNAADGAIIYEDTNQVYRHGPVPSGQACYYTIWVNNGFYFVPPPN